MLTSCAHGATGFAAAATPASKRFGRSPRANVVPAIVRPIIPPANAAMAARVRPARAIKARYLASVPTPTAKMVLTRKGRIFRNAAIAMLAIGAAAMAANVFTVDAAAAQSDNIAMSDVAAGPAEAASTAPRKSGDEISLVTALNSPSIAGYTVVGSGESLWQIAAARTRAGGDVRDQVAAIKTANGLGDDYVFAGQVLRLPASN